MTTSKGKEKRPHQTIDLRQDTVIYASIRTTTKGKEKRPHQIIDSRQDTVMYVSIRTTTKGKGKRTQKPINVTSRKHVGITWQSSTIAAVVINFDVKAVVTASGRLYCFLSLFNFLLIFLTTFYLQCNASLKTR